MLAGGQGDCSTRHAALWPPSACNSTYYLSSARSYPMCGQVTARWSMQACDSCCQMVAGHVKRMKRFGACPPPSLPPTQWQCRREQGAAKQTPQQQSAAGTTAEGGEAAAGGTAGAGGSEAAASAGQVSGHAARPLCMGGMQHGTPSVLLPVVLAVPCTHTWLLHPWSPRIRAECECCERAAAAVVALLRPHACMRQMHKQLHHGLSGTHAKRWLAGHLLTSPDLT